MHAITSLTDISRGRRTLSSATFSRASLLKKEQHHFLLADLKFYYDDTEDWFLEKGHQVLDGAGAGA